MSRAAGMGEWRPALGFLLPNLLGFLLFCAGPMLFSLAISFSNWDLTRPQGFQWIGLDNYRELASDAKFWTYLINTAYLMLGLPVAIAGSLFLAILLTGRQRGVVVYRTLFYLPTFTSGVAVFILWKSLYNPEFGPINAILDRFLSWAGIPDLTAPNWLTSVRNILGLEVERIGLSRQMTGLGAREAIIIMGIWIAIGGNNMLLYIAALSNVPPELYEAAEVDGANAWARFRHVTCPQIAPTTFLIVVLSLIGGLQGGFEQARVMTGGGPSGTTTTLAYYIYTKSFEEFQVGYASAVSWVLLSIVFLLTLVTWKYGNKAMSY